MLYCQRQQSDPVGACWAAGPSSFCYVNPWVKKASGQLMGVGCRLYADCTLFVSSCSMMCSQLDLLHLHAGKCCPTLDPLPCSTPLTPAPPDQAHAAPRLYVSQPPDSKFCPDVSSAALQ